MTKDDFLHELEFELGFLPRSKVNEAVEYYSSFFNNSKSDDEITAEIGTPKEAAGKFYREHFKESTQTEDSEYNNTYNTETVPKRKFPWGILALVILSPVIVPCVLGILAVIALIAAIPFLVSVGMFIGGIGMVWDSIFKGAAVYSSLVQAGIGCIMLAIGLVLVCVGIMILIKVGIWIIRAISDFGNKRVHGTVNR